MNRVYEDTILIVTTLLFTINAIKDQCSVYYNKLTKLTVINYVENLLEIDQTDLKKLGLAICN